MAMRYFQQYPASQDSWREPLERRCARMDLLFERRRDAHVAKRDLNASCHDRSRAVVQQMSSHSSIFESWNDCTVIRLSTWAMPRAIPAIANAVRGRYDLSDDELESIEP
jgi:hypothetical protein